MFIGWEATPKTCIGSPRVTSGCYSLQEWRHAEWSEMHELKQDWQEQEFLEEEGHSEDCIGSPRVTLGHCPHRSRDTDARSLLSSPAAGCTTGTSSTRTESGGSRPATSSKSQRSGLLGQARGLCGLPCRRMASVREGLTWEE